MKIFPTGLLIALLAFGASCKHDVRDTSDPLTLIQTVTDRVIRETIFDFRLVEKHETHGLQYINFNDVYCKSATSGAWAASFIFVETDTLMPFGISYAGEISVWVNDEKVFDGPSKNEYIFEEYTYDRFHFDANFSAHLKPGYNKIIVRNNVSDQNWLFFLHPIDKWGNQNRGLRFTLENFAPAIKNDKWLLLGISKGDENFHTYETLFAENNMALNYETRGRYLTWDLPAQTILKGFIIPDTFAFHRESYADWHYAIGAMDMVFLELAELAGRPDYTRYVKQYNDFILEHYNYFSHEFHNLHAIRGSYHRLIRGVMLDDCGAPTLGMLEYTLQNPDDQSARWLINEMADFVRNHQERLEDGTFARPEPYPMTIWADDLFMSVPFMLRMAELTSDPSWYDDVVLQVVNFNQYLYNSEKGIFKHGWFDHIKEPSPVFWARANGWVTWGTAEALLKLPADHPGYNTVLSLFQRHMEGLKKYQHKDGLWHQVLDHPESYLETSASAMFVLAMARGVRMGWLDESFREIALKGWEGITTQISPDGIVSGICQGTAIGETLQFYFDRQTFDNDTRGLGAVITAGMEIHLMGR
jgi:unsaturated rhamnogalacturonyl hydrolase